MINCPTPKDQARGVAFAQGRGKARPDLDSSRRLGCPTVGANCRRYVTTDAMGMAKERGSHEEEDVDGAGIGLSTNTV